MTYPRDAVCARCGATPVYAKNCCARCYQYMRRHGVGRFANRPRCAVEGCDKVSYESVDKDDGMCINHYSVALRRANDALVLRSSGD